MADYSNLTPAQQQVLAEIVADLERLDGDLRAAHGSMRERLAVAGIPPVDPDSEYCFICHFTPTPCQDFVFPSGAPLLGLDCARPTCHHNILSHNNTL